jgi:hypothetical protein
MGNQTLACIFPLIRKNISIPIQAKTIEFNTSISFLELLLSSFNCINKLYQPFN